MIATKVKLLAGRSPGNPTENHSPWKKEAKRMTELPSITGK
jgi:hypothetical protein